MSNVFIPTLRRRLSADPSTAYDPPSDESVMNAPPAGMGGGPYSPPSTTTAPSQPASAPSGPYTPQQSPEFQRLQSAYAAPHAGTLRQVLGAFLGARNPTLGGIISGETGRNRNIENAEREYGLIANAIIANRAAQTADVTNRLHTAEAGKAEAETGAIPAKAALENAQAEAANYKEDPNLGLIDLRTKQPVNPNALAPLSKEEADALGKQEGERVPLKLKNTANEIVNRGFATINTEEGVYERNRGTGSMTRLGSNPRMMFAPSEQYTPVAADPNNPGNVTLMKKGQAAAQNVSLPASATTQAAKTEARSEVPTKIGDQKVAFNTMIQHADLLRAAARALNNGENQTLAGLENRFKNEFGYSGPITAQAIADAYGGEVTNVIAKGHITDKEMEKTSKTLDPLKQNYETVDKVLTAYQALAQSKMNMLNQQANAAKGGGTAAPRGGITAADMLKKYPPKH